MKPSMRIPSLLAALFFIASSALGDDATNYNKSGEVKFIKGDLNGALADCNKAIELKSDYRGFRDGFKLMVTWPFGSLFWPLNPTQIFLIHLPIC